MIYNNDNNNNHDNGNIMIMIMIMTMKMMIIMMMIIIEKDPATTADEFFGCIYARRHRPDSIS